MLGYVTQFDRINHKGMAYCKDTGKQVGLFSFSLFSGDSLNVGDYVSFPESRKDGRPQAATVLIPARRYQPKFIPPEELYGAAVCLHKPKNPGHQKKPAITSNVPTEDHDTCSSCHKRMIPQLVISQGVPERSYCPFCGTTHKDFRQVAQPTVLEQGKMITADALITGAIGAIVMAALGL